MSNFIRFLLSIFDRINEKKLRNFFFKEFGKNIDVIVDVGAHHGEKIKFFLKYFNINKIFAFEASPINFNILKKKKFINSSKIEIYCLAVGPKDCTTLLNQTIESSSSTLVKINANSKYFIRKKKILDLFSIKKYYKKIQVKMISGISFLENNQIKKINILKIDTEGFDFDVIKSFEKKIQDINYIFFEHHFHDMLLKNYNLSDVHNYLVFNKFKKVLKLKMPFRKAFEYVYKNEIGNF